MAEIVLAASSEMAEAEAWYDERVSGLGERFLGEAEAAFARIDEMPVDGFGDGWDRTVVVTATSGDYSVRTSR